MTVIPLPVESGAARCSACGEETWRYPVRSLDGVTRRVHFDENPAGKWIVGPDGYAHRVPMSVDAWLKVHTCEGHESAWD